MSQTVLAPPARSRAPGPAQIAGATTVHRLARRQLSDAVVGPHWFAGATVAALVLVAWAAGRNVR